MADGLSIGEQFTDLETPLVEQLTGVGLWIDNAALAPANRAHARLA